MNDLLLAKNLRAAFCVCGGADREVNTVSLCGGDDVPSFIYAGDMGAVSSAVPLLVK